MNYQELVDASVAYSDRYTDIEVSSNLNTFIILVEARINRLLKTRQQTARVYTPTVNNQEFYALPPDWRGMRHIEIIKTTSQSKPNTSASISITDPQSFENKKSNPDGLNYYLIIDDQIKITPILSAGCSLEIVYYQKVPNLNINNVTNWLSIDHPDIYLAGITGEISLFAKDYDAATGWFNRLSVAVEELDTVDWKERWSGDPLQVRIV